MRKKRFSKKARAAALRNLKKARRARRKRNPVLVTGKNLRTRRVGKRKSYRSKAKRRRGPNKAKKTFRRRKMRKSGHRKSAKRVAAGKKAARTRKRHKAAHRRAHYTPASHQLTAETRKRRRKRRKNPVSATPVAAERKRRRRRRKNPVSAAAEAPRRRRRAKARRHPRKRGLHYTSKRTGRRRTRRMRGNDARRGWDRRKGRRIRRNPVAKERRRHRRSHARRRRNPLPNPISGMMEFVGGVLGVGAGFGLASLVDRMIVTHALTTAATSGQGGGTDQPAVGQIYNSEALFLPIWNSWQRLVGAGASIVAPLVLARFAGNHPGAKAFLQLAGFGALGRTAGKAMDDAVAATMASNANVQRLYSGEIAAKAKLAQATTTALPAVAPGMFAGVRRAYVNQTQPVRQFAGAPTQHAPGSFQQLPSRIAGLGSSTPDPDVEQVANVLPLNRPIPNAQPPVPASTSLFVPALCNPDNQS